MRIARYSHGEDVSFGVVEGLDEAGVPGPDAAVAQVDSHPFGPVTLTGVRHRLSDVRLLAPVLPSKVVAVAKNYAAHAEEMGTEVPGEPMIFLKPSTSVIGPGAAIALPPQSDRVEHEAELAVVIGRMCREVPLDRVGDVVLGFTCANDVTARDLQARDGQWGRAKGFDTFCPLGPWIDTDVDPEDLRVTCTVDGAERQSGSTALMVRDVAELVSWISDVMTLLPGDVILTGTPAGVGPLTAGELVSVTIDGIGTLTNQVVTRD
ncbi:MAG: fumarylacetoacetate hydrolase family protein [Candidatus Nanopelagicales bacterium]